MRRWTVGDGLPVAGINGLAQTADGHLWLATWDGLVRFDGVRFTSFDATSNPELAKARFTALFHTADDALWLSTEYHDLVRFRGGRFETVIEADPDERLNTIDTAPSGGLLLGIGNRVARSAPEGIEPVAAGLAGEVLAVHQGPTGRIWAGTGQGALFRVETGVAVPVTRESDAPEGAVVSLLETAGGLLVGTSRGLWRLPEGAPAERIPFPAGEADPAILAVQEDSDGRVWVATAAALYRVQDGRLVHRAPVAGLTGAEPLTVRWPALGGAAVGANASPRLLDGPRELLAAGSTIKDLLVDREGSLWVATAADGLYQLQVPGIATLGRPEGLPRDNVYSVVEGPDGALWLGTIGGLARLRNAELSWWAGGSDLPFEAVWTVLVDDGGQVWVGGDRGLCRLQGDLCAPFDLPPPDPRSPVRALFEDASGRIWIGAASGVFVLQGASAARVPGLGAAPGRRTARSFLQAGDGALWIGTAGGGLLRIAGESVDRLTTAQGLASDVVRALHEDGRGRLWVGTEGRGLCRITDPGAATRRIECVDSSRGLYDDGIHRILEDARGRFWMSTNRGIFRVALRELDAVLDGRQERLDCRSFTERHGLRHREANGGVQSAGTRTSDGRLWFPTQAGVVIFDPAQASPVPPPVPVFDRVVFGGDVLAQPTGSVELPRGVRDVTFAYTASSFLDPDQVRFRHRLVGYDRRWVEAGGRREARYTNLPPGRYELQVDARSADGLRSEEPVRLAVVVPAYLWETAWFRGGAGMAFLAAVGLGVRRRLQAQERRQRLLERQVEDRTSALAQQAEATERALATVREQHQLLEEMSEAKMRFFANVSHELRTPLTLLLGPLREAATDRRPPAPEEREMMLRNAVRLERLLDLIRDLQKIDAGGFHLRFERFDLARLAAGVAGAFAPLAERKGIGLASRLPEEPVATDADPEQIERILGNLLSNAIKFVPAGGTVELCLEAADEEVVLSVTDDGPGVPADAVPRIFERFFQLDATGVRAAEGMGIGLAMARELARLHGGEIEVASEPGEGSRFTVRWPRFRRDAAPEPVEEPTHDPLEVPVDEPVPGPAPTTGGPGVAEPRHPTGDPATPADQGRKTVLVVDDNADVRTFVRGVLEPEWKVLEAADGGAALATARRALPDLVLADVTMPEMDGFELARRLRNDPETGIVPIVFLTARAEERDLVEGFEAGGDQYVTKPFSPDVLRARVSGIFEQRLALRRRLLEEAVRSAQADQEGEADQGTGEDAAPEDGFAGRARRVVRRRLPDEAFGIDRLAAELAVSRRQLYRLLADEGAPAPAELIREERLARAAELLRTGEGTVSEVAYAVGFGSLAAFSRRFRERYGVPPSAYA
ncbi:MAG: two-component regulator propeller domain-containing protein [Thermoanaerobaculia bacterium]